ncbi:radical SAM domain protein [Leptospira inadai serovar Lyme str. 10]|uniref:Radical SAM domain protein n=2 Tax=Leptospira inadai serovar Lyme TaxID=293084 RepID=V6HMX7_9LEPT|nr:PA0069 family radical SAM protein [Leptospira inadai]EQA38250.1 radical SAM domain protein [Leptospira inadai serovar Lyme str. 10]PNV74036.1 radical SAM protein [Leptospira inadai serovar Lyme]
MKKQRRGTTSAPEGRFDSISREIWKEDREEDAVNRTTQFFSEDSKSILTHNDSPDIPIDASLNPYRGCEHGCIYCFARPNHAYVDLSPGIDFESKIFVKKNVDLLLIHELKKRKGPVETITLGTATDPYQPGERTYRNTRKILEVLLKFRQPTAIITKSSLILRDIDILSEMGKLGILKVYVSVTTLDKELWSALEPRAPAPGKRLDAIRGLSKGSVPVGAMFAPVIPFLNDSEMETILEEVKQAGALSAGMVLLRLPYEVSQLFVEWLEINYPLKKEKILRVLREARGGKLYDSDFSQRMTGTGTYAELLQTRFRLAIKRFDLNERASFRKDLFRIPEEYQVRPSKNQDLLPGLF